MSFSLLQRIQSAISRRAYAFTLHAVRQAEERRITPSEVEEAILAEAAEIIEDYRMEQCAFCRGDLEAKTILYTTEFKGRVAVVENVPALVCGQCGEIVLRPEVVEKLQRIVWGELPQTGTVRVPFYDFTQVG